MFESISRENVYSHRASFASLITSLAAHSALACLLIAVPLLMIQNPVREIFLIAPTVPLFNELKPSPPPESARKTAAGKPAAGIEERGTRIRIKYNPAPISIPNTVPPPSDENVVYRIGNEISLIGGGPGGETGPGINAAGLVNSLIDERSLPKKNPVLVEKRPPVRVGTLESSKVILRVSPVYPKLAAQMRISGEVVIEALIDEEGNVSGLSVVKGHTLLRDAAIEAVRQWKFSPTVQNGEPIPILATITIAFKIK